MNVQKQLYKLICYSILSITSIYAQTAEDIAQKAHIANINTLLIFTGQEGLTSGTYDFTKVGVEMQVYHLPFTYHLKSDNSSLNYLLVGNVGYSKVYLSQDIEIPPNSRLNYENHLRTYTSGIGGGVRYKLTKELSLLGGVELIYSRSGASVKEPDDSLGDAIEDFFDKTYNDNISYKFFALAEYKPEVDYLKPYIRVSYKLYETKSTFSFSDLSSFDTQSAVSTVVLGAQSDELFSLNQNYLTLEAYTSANHLNGEVSEVVKFDSYASLGAIAYWYTKNEPSSIERFFLEVNTIRADGLEGYNVGIGFSIDY